MRTCRFIGVFLLQSLLCVVWVSAAHAIPVFARRYQTACSTCHLQYPRLNAAGEAFRRNGHRFLPNDAAQHIPPPVTLVAEARRELWPDSDWPADLPAVPPISVSLGGAVVSSPDSDVRPPGEPVVRFDRIFRSASLLLGARLGDEVSAFAQVGLGKDGAGLGRGYVTVSRLVGVEALQLRVGQFEPQIASFSSQRRISGPAYRLLGDPVRPAAWGLESALRGANLSATLLGRLGIDLGYGQATLTSPLDEPLPQVPRDAYAHVFYKLGGLRLDDVQDSMTARDERSVQLGVFAFLGTHTLDLRKTVEDPPAQQEDALDKVGADILVRFDQLEAIVAAAYERHDFEVSEDTDRLQTLAEVTYFILPWLSTSARGELEMWVEAPRHRLVPSLALTPRMNLRTTLYATIDEGATDQDGWHVTEVNLGASCAF
jgi:hypothetical protein